MGTLAGHTALMTGGTGGIGKALGPVDVLVNNAAIAGPGPKNAWELAAGSYERTHSTKSPQDACRGSFSRKASYFSRSDVNRVTGTVIEELGRIDILVNNAGITERKPFLEIEREAGDSVMAVNLTGRDGVVMA